MLIALIAAFSRLPQRQAEPALKQPDKPAPSRAPEKPNLKEYNLQIGLLGPWTVETFAKASISPIAIADACHDRAPSLPGEVGGFLGLAGCVFGLAEAGMSWRATIQLAIAIRQSRAQKRDNKPAAKAFEKAKTAERENKSKADEAERADSSRQEQTHPASDEITVESPLLARVDRSSALPASQSEESDNPASIADH
ncbi:hypothetical protein FNU76_02750 [Chitinimonas arctica]|uniref:Uncharacterized protein n=1 Tax=Chitinimonas arctica TaxID=2594795 RepID=A0A516SBB2_9NEIS|nr:hypothetical protein [Chitinimonas arctica]QDQ25358.1 hypothetical protein FNU76_02750 [Chitinimonas arctica]